MKSELNTKTSGGCIWLKHPPLVMRASVVFMLSVYDTSLNGEIDQEYYEFSNDLGKRFVPAEHVRKKL